MYVKKNIVKDRVSETLVLVSEGNQLQQLEVCAKSRPNAGSSQNGLHCGTHLSVSELTGTHQLFAFYRLTVWRGISIPFLSHGHSLSGLQSLEPKHLVLFTHCSACSLRL